MASKTFWKDSEMGADPQFDGHALQQLLDQPPAGQDRKFIGMLMKHYRRSFGLNLLFLFLTLALYFWMPKPDLLFPLGIISVCFLFLLIQVFRAAKSTSGLEDMSVDLHTALTRTLESNRKLNKSLHAAHTSIITGSFASGFLLGLLVGDWTLVKIFTEPILVLVWVFLTVGVYFLARTSYFKTFQRSINPGYFRTKQYLEAQLKALE